MKDLKSQIERSMADKIKSYGAGSSASAKPTSDAHEINATPIKHRAAGGAIEGGPAKSRMDRGGKKKSSKGGKTTVNVVIAGKGEDKPPMPPMPMPMPPAGAMPPPKPPMMPPPGPPMPPPGAGPGGPPMPMRASGGRLTAGAGSGEGRLEKAESAK